MKEVVVISGKGGTGKTTLTASLSALWENKVIADCDVDAADLHLLLNPKVQKRTDFYGGVKAVINNEICTACGQCREVCKYDAISPDFVVDEIACEGCGVCPYFCPADAISLVDRHSGEWYISDTRFGPLVHAKLGIAEENSGKLVSLIRREAKILAEDKGLDKILVDGSPGIGCPVISSVTGASLIVIVAEPTVSGVHDMERVIQLANHFQIPVAVVVNKADLNEKMTDRIQSETAKRNLFFLGKIPYDPIVTQAMIQRKTVVEFGENAVAQQIIEIGNKILAKLEE